MRTSQTTPPASRVTLRPFRADDAKALHPIFADARAMRYWSTAPHATLAETEAFVRATIEASDAGYGDDQVVVYEGRVVGKAGLWNNTEIGFILSPAVWGLGLAGEAVGAVIDRAREQGVDRILADVDPRNEPCRRLLIRMGFVQTGHAEHTLKVGDEWVDSIYFELTLNSEGCAR
jgi:RimJ/RimL family protein N-acetyltransferase